MIRAKRIGNACSVNAIIALGATTSIAVLLVPRAAADFWLRRLNRGIIRQTAKSSHSYCAGKCSDSHSDSRFRGTRRVADAATYDSTKNHNPGDDVDNSLARGR
jgi:hypothetical protein